jgi:hypothetical protein
MVRMDRAVARLKERSQGSIVRRGEYGAEQLLSVNREDKDEKRFGEKIRLCRSEHEDRSGKWYRPLFAVVSRGST